MVGAAGTPGPSRNQRTRRSIMLGYAKTCGICSSLERIPRKSSPSHTHIHLGGVHTTQTWGGGAVPGPQTQNLPAVRGQDQVLHHGAFNSPDVFLFVPLKLLYFLNMPQSQVGVRAGVFRQQPSSQETEPRRYPGNSRELCPFGWR